MCVYDHPSKFIPLYQHLYFLPSMVHKHDILLIFSTDVDDVDTCGEDARGSLNGGSEEVVDVLS